MMTARLEPLFVAAEQARATREKAAISIAKDVAHGTPTSVRDVATFLEAETGYLTALANLRDGVSKIEAEVSGDDDTALEQAWGT